MADNKANNAEVLDRLFDSFAEAEKTEKELDAELTEAGIDPIKIVTDGMEKIGKLKAQLRLKLATQRKGLLQKAREKIEAHLLEVENPIEALVQLLGGQNQLQPQGFWSKLESLDRDEALEMLNEDTLLDMLEQLENDEDNETR